MSEAGWLIVAFLLGVLLMLPATAGLMIKNTDAERYVKHHASGEWEAKGYALSDVQKFISWMSASGKLVPPSSSLPHYEYTKIEHAPKDE